MRIDFRGFFSDVANDLHELRLGHTGADSHGNEGIDDDYWILQGEDGKYEAMFTFLLKITSDAEINVYEIGAVTPVGNSSSSFYPVLMERTVLAEPVTIPAGGTRALEYRVIINQF